MRALKMPWPQFEGEEMNDLLAFMRYLRGRSPAGVQLLPANPHRGWALFREKGCISCHAIRGEGGSVGPDLGADQPVAPHSDRDGRADVEPLSGDVGSHEGKGYRAPHFSGQEMADLISFLYSVRYFDLGGSPIIGQELFDERKCSQCHGSEASGAKKWSQTEEGWQVLHPVNFALALWSHGPRMHAKAEAMGLGWPTLNEGDLSHLLAFLNSQPVNDKR